MAFGSGMGIARPVRAFVKLALDKFPWCAILTLMRIDTSKISGWRLASKTQPITAKPLINLLVDRKVSSKFLVDTLEGQEPLGDGVVICVGAAGDAWQQMPKKLLQKYDVTSIDQDGWMVCTPKPDNAVDCYEVTKEYVDSVCMAQGGWFGTFTIIGQWGATVGEEKNVQKGELGDFLCRNRTDPTDVWIVKRKLFLNTYVVKS